MADEWDRTPRLPVGLVQAAERSESSAIRRRFTPGGVYSGAVGIFTAAQCFRCGAIPRSSAQYTSRLAGTRLVGGPLHRASRKQSGVGRTHGTIIFTVDFSRTSRIGTN